MVECLLNFSTHVWNFDQDIVNVFRAQCATSKHEKFMPKLPDIMYPTVISSLALPAATQSSFFSVRCKFDLEKFRLASANLSNDEEEEKAGTPVTNANHISHAKSNSILQNWRQLKTRTLSALVLVHQESSDHTSNIIDADFVSFQFGYETTTQQVIKDVWHKVQRRLEVCFHNLQLCNFVLKTCGREEYLKFNDNSKIVQSNFVRNCLRNMEVENKLEFVLLYISDLNAYNDEDMRLTAAEYYRKNSYSEEIFTYYTPKLLASELFFQSKRGRGKSHQQSASFSSFVFFYFLFLFFCLFMYFLQFLCMFFFFFCMIFVFIHGSMLHVSILQGG